MLQLSAATDRIAGRGGGAAPCPGTIYGQIGRTTSHERAPKTREGSQSSQEAATDLAPVDKQLERSSSVPCRSTFGQVASVCYTI